MNKLILSAALALSTACFAANKDEDALRKRISEFQDAFNKHDAKLVAGFFAEDGDLVNPMGITGRGRGEVEKVVAGDLTNFIRDGKTTFTVTNIHFVKPDVAIVDMTHELSGVHGPDGAEMAAMKVLVTGVAVKKGDTWSWAAGRPMVPFMPPPPPPALASPAAK